MSNLSRESFRYYFKIKDWKPTNSNLIQAFKRIQKDERERIQKFYFQEDVKSALIGRLLIRKIINQRFNLNNSEIWLKRNDKGRPYLSFENNVSTDEQIFNQSNSCDLVLNSERDKDNSTKFDFNISHHGDYCVGVGENVRRIGVDVMKIERRFRDRSVDDYFKLMDKKFTVNEWNFINAIESNDNERIKRFMRMWTLKESFVKADGCGLTIDLRRIDFNCKTDQLKTNETTNDTILSFDGQIQTNWTFIEYLLDHEYCVAIAINKSNNVDNRCLNRIQFDQLIDGLNELYDNESDENLNVLNADGTKLSLEEWFDSKKIR